MLTYAVTVSIDGLGEFGEFGNKVAPHAITLVILTVFPTGFIGMFSANSTSSSYNNSKILRLSIVIDYFKFVQRSHMFPHKTGNGCSTNMELL